MSERDAPSNSHQRSVSREWEHVADPPPASPGKESLAMERQSSSGMQWLAKLWGGHRQREDGAPLSAPSSAGCEVLRAADVPPPPSDPTLAVDLGTAASPAGLAGLLQKVRRPARPPAGARSGAGAGAGASGAGSMDLDRSSPDTPASLASLPEAAAAPAASARRFGVLGLRGRDGDGAAGGAAAEGAPAGELVVGQGDARAGPPNPFGSPAGPLPVATASTASGTPLSSPGSSLDGSRLTDPVAHPSPPTDAGAPDAPSKLLGAPAQGLATGSGLAGAELASGTSSAPVVAGAPMALADAAGEAAAPGQAQRSGGSGGGAASAETAPPPSAHKRSRSWNPLRLTKLVGRSASGAMLDDDGGAPVRLLQFSPWQAIP